MTDEKSHTAAAEPHGVPQATDTRKNATCALSGQEKRSGGHLDPIEATRATAGQFGHPADGGLIEREAALSAICSHAHYDDDWGDLVCAIRAIPAAQPALDEDKIGALIRVREIALQAETAPLSMMEIVKRVDMGLHEETEIPGWMLEPAAQDVAHPDDLPDDLCVLSSYASAAPAAQPLLPGAQVGSEPGIPAAQPAQRAEALVWGDDGVAEALGLRYILSDPSYSYTGGWEVLEETTNTPMPDADGSAEDAKAAAQADYERRILSAMEPAAPDGEEVEMAQCKAFSAGYEAGEKATAGGEELAKLRTEVERLRAVLAFYGDISKYPAPLTGGAGELYFDCGQRARAALRANEQGEG